MATPTISVTATVGAIYTKDYGTVKFDWTISNPDGYELVSVAVVRATAGSGIFQTGKTVTLPAGLGFNPIDTTGSWTDTGLALTKDISSNETTNYAFTLNFLEDGSAAAHSPGATSVVIPHLNAVVSSPSEDYCTDSCWDFGSKKAYATFEGKASLNGENNTQLILTLTGELNGQTAQVGFITDSSLTPANGGGYSNSFYKIGTSGANTDALATQALHVAFAAFETNWTGIGLEDLTFSRSPASYTAETSITLTQADHGAIGNTDVTGTMNSGSVYINGVPFNKDFTAFTKFKGGRVGSDLSISLSGYFEDPLSQSSSFDIDYCLNKPNADGIGDAEFYLNLPKEASITSFVPNGIISTSDTSYVPAFEDAPGGMSNRWKVSIAYPGSGATNFGQGTSSASTKATALFQPKLAINGDTGKTLTIHNTDGSLVTFTTAAAAPSASTATTIGTTGASTDILATQAFHVAFKAAIGDGTLKATLTPSDFSGTETSITLTQDIVGTIGNTTFTHTGTVITAAHLYINGAAWTSGTSAFGDTTATTPQTAGAPANAYAVFEPQAALKDDDKTIISIFNEDWSYAYFQTDDSTAYTASYSDATQTIIGTSGIGSDDDKATESFHIAFTEAIAAGKLNSYYLLPKVYTDGDTSITLIHKTPGTVGNKRLVGDIDSSSLDVNGNDFNTGTSGTLAIPTSFVGGTDMPPFESHSLSKLLPPSYGKFGTVYIDKPLGDGLISFDAENTRVQVIPEKLPSLYLTFDSDLSSSGAYSPTVATLSGTPTISTSTWMRGGGALSLDGSSGINIPDTTGATDLDGDFTIDFWVNPAGGGHTPFLIGSGGTYGAGTSKQWALSCSATTIVLHYNASGTWIDDSTTAPIVGWTHIAMVRSGDEVKIYVDGSHANTITSSISSMSFDYSGINIGQPMTSAPTVGAADHGDKLDGYIDGLRIHKGVARWTNIFPYSLGTGPDSTTTNAIYDGTGNMNNKKGAVVFGQVRNDEGGIPDVGLSYSTMHHSSTDYLWLPIDTKYSPDNIWQTGPPLTKCVDELNIGYGDHSYHLKAFDSNTFDVEYCLKTGDMDTFIIMCAMTDFKTKIAAVEKQFGDAADNGWDLSFKNISPGFAVIYGHGTKKIKPSGLGTLLRVYLDSPLIQQNPSTDPDTSVCTYPIFLNLGESNYRQFQQYISEVDTESAKRILDTEDSLWTQMSGDFQWGGDVLASDRLSGSGIIKELRWLVWGADPRLGSVATSLADNIERVLKEYSTDVDQEAIITNAAAAGHYFRIFFMAYINLIRSLPSIQDKMDFTWNKMSTGVSALCDFALDWGRTDDASYCASNDNELVIYIYYGNIFTAAAGVEIDFTELKGILDASNGITLSDANSWGKKKYNIINNKLNGLESDGGIITDQSYIGAYDGEFMQAYNSDTGKYLAVYNAQILSQNIQTLNSPYLKNKPNQAGLFGADILTTIVLDVSAVSDKCSGSTMDGLMNGLATAINTDLKTAKLVGNELVGKPSSENWTGDSYNIGGGNSLDIKDFLTTAMFAVGGTTPSTDLTEAKIESTFKLPKSALQADGTHKTVKQYYNIANLDLTGATFPTGDSLNAIDADGDGKIDITDVVALRNIWVLKDEYPTTSSAGMNSGLSVVPSEKCVSFNSDIELLLPTNCSTFLVTPSCFAKTWISDLIAVYSEEAPDDGTVRIPEKYLAEISYSVDCKDEGGNTVEDISGVQFKLDGVRRNGILGTEHGAEDGSAYNATAIKNANWAEHIVNSVVDENNLETKDTYFAYSTTGDYISKGSGVLCYLTIPSDSMMNADEMMARESFLNITTNKEESSFKDTLNKATYPLANIRFKSLHVNELEIFEKYGLRVINTKITSNQSYDGSAYSSMAHAADSGWIGIASAGPAGVLLHFDGTNAAQSPITDSGTGPVICTAVGNAQFDTSLSSPASGNTSSFKFDGTGDYVKIDDHDLLHWDREFTIDMWVRSKNLISGVGSVGIFYEGSVATSTTTPNQNQPPMEHSTGTFNISKMGDVYGWNDHAWLLSLGKNSSAYGVSGGAGDTTTNNLFAYQHNQNGVAAYADDTWHHIAVTRDSSSDIRFFVDGREMTGDNVWAGTTGDTPFNYTGTFNPATYVYAGDYSGYLLGIGGAMDGSAYAYDFVGNIDELRIVKDSAKWTANFTAPTAPYNNTTDLEGLVYPTITESNINTALVHAATGIYNVVYDSDAGGVVDIADVQALAHVVYDGSFDFSTNNVTPKECCPYTAPSIPNLVLIDFKDDVIPVIIEGAKKIIEVDIDGNELDCTSMVSGHEGGIFLHWNPVSSADYYIVYRQEVNKKAIPIIATAPGGGRAILKDFVKRERGSSNTPTQVATTTWIDFPPALTSGCLDFSEGGDSAGGTLDDTLSKYKYWVDAVNKDGATTSHKIIGSSVSCRYAPTCADFNIVVKSDSTHYGDFQVSHPFAPSPIGGCYADSSQTDTGDCLPVWVFAQDAAGSHGQAGTSNKLGTIITQGRMPNAQGLGGKNKVGFKYISKKDFVGEDKFKYSAIVKDSESPDNIAEWCRTDAEVTVYVKPKSPILSSFIEPCCSDDEGKIKLTWPSVNGAESYFVYEDVGSGWVKVSTIVDNGDQDVFEYKEEPTGYAAFKAACEIDPQPLDVEYKVSATKYMSGITYESDSNEVNPIMTCCDPLDNPTLSYTLSGFCDLPLDINGVVTLTWSAVSGADYYNIYRRGSYTGSSTTVPFEYVGRAEGSLQFVDQVQGCVGCPSTNVKYDYYATSVQEEYPDCNTEGTIKQVEIACCNTTPVAHDQSIDVEYETELSGQILKAVDPEGNIASYTIGSASSGTLVTDTATGVFSFTPDLGFYTTKDGTVTFTWTATDDCSVTSNTGTVTITVKSPPECLEYDYIICNANFPWLTDQQDTSGVRLKTSTLKQVMFMLNNKGVPSLRKRCGAYTVTRGLNPSVLALSDDDCGFGIEGCTDSNYLEYNPLAMNDDGSCQTLKIYGCMDETASNYNASANVDDGSCTYAASYTADYLFHLDGNVTNACAGTATMTLTQGGGSYVTGQSGFGNALQFDGVLSTGTLLELAFAGSNPACGSSDLCMDGEFTLDFWVKFANNERTPNEYLGSHTGITTGIFTSTNQGLVPEFSLGYLEPPPAFGLPTYVLQFLSPGATSQFGNTQNFYDLGGSQLTGWHHIAITRDGSNSVRLFLDGAGVPVASPASNGDSDAGFTDTSTFDLHLFQFGSYGNWSGLDFDGQCDEIRIHKDACLWDAEFDGTTFITSPDPSSCS